MKQSLLLKLLFVFAVSLLFACGSSSAKEPVLEGDEEKPQSSAYDTDSHTDCEIGDYKIEVPSGWPANPPYYYPENHYIYEDQGFAMLYTYPTGEFIDEKTLISKKIRDDLYEGMTDSSSNAQLKVSEERTVNGKKMNYISYTDTLEGIPGLMRSYWFVNSEDEEVLAVLFFQGENSVYSYRDDFEKIMASLK